MVFYEESYSKLISSVEGGFSLVELVRVLLGDNSRTGDNSSKLFSLFTTRRLFVKSDNTTSDVADDVWFKLLEWQKQGLAGCRCPTVVPKTILGMSHSSQLLSAGWLRKVHAEQGHCFSSTSPDEKSDRFGFDRDPTRGTSNFGQETETKKVLIKTTRNIFGKKWSLTIPLASTFLT